VRQGRQGNSFNLSSRGTLTKRVFPNKSPSFPLVTIVASAAVVTDGATTEAARLDALSNRIIGAALRVHSVIGPGCLESAYEGCLWFELVESGLRVQRQVLLPLMYQGRRVDSGYRIDLLVEGEMIVEVKAIERIERVHRAQLLCYLRLTKLKLGLLINFNVASLRDGIRRIVNGFPE